MNNISENDIIESFELCDSPHWLMWLLLSIGIIGLIIIAIYLFTGKKKGKRSRKK